MSKTKTTNTTSIQITQDKLVEEIAKRLKLSMVQFGAWRATRKNAEESRLLNERHGTENEGKVTVRQCDHESLHKIYSLNSKAYNEHKKITLPSVQDGVRVVITGKEFEHSDMMKKFSDLIRTEIDVLVKAGAYWGGEEFKRQRVKLNGLFDERAWPSDPDDLRSKFYLKSNYLTCPTEGAWAEWLVESARAAMNEVEEQLEEAFKRVSVRCMGPNIDGASGKLHETVFTGLEAVLDRIATLDIENRYSKVVEKAKDIAKYRAEEIRKDPDTRRELSKRADQLTEMFAGLRG